MNKSKRISRFSYLLILVLLAFSIVSCSGETSDNKCSEGFGDESRCEIREDI